MLNVKFTQRWGYVLPGCYTAQVSRLGMAIYKLGVPNQIMPVDTIPGPTFEKLVIGGVVVEDTGLEPVPDLSDLRVTVHGDAIRLWDRPEGTVLEERLA